MKYVKLGVILLGVMLVVGGCEKGVIPESPTPISPNDVWEGNLSFHTFIWESVEEADYYALQISSDEGFTKTVFTDSTIQDTIYKVVADSFVTDTLYYWRVAAGNEVGWSEWSTTARFYRGGEEMLISPEDGEVLVKETPSFVWRSYPNAEDYTIRVCQGTFDILNTVWEDTTHDTTYKLPFEEFWRDYDYTNTYTWAVLVKCMSNGHLWTSPREFTPKAIPDLYTTYFPFGLGYEWVYERTLGEEWDYSEGDWKYYTYDTFSVRVTDSFWIADTLFFKTENDLPDMENPIKIWTDSIIVYIPDWVLDTFTILEPSDAHIYYYGDTLRIHWSGWKGYFNLTRAKGIGVTWKNDDRYPSERWEEWNRLLYFYNGKDTIYKALGG